VVTRRDSWGNSLKINKIDKMDKMDKMDKIEDMGKGFVTPLMHQG
jgi:hypothetical protein